MYCVIQEIKLKRDNYKPTSKTIEVAASTLVINGETCTTYNFYYSSEKFDRPIKKAYKISIHKSYRKNGKIKKKQWHICTMDYYALLEFCPQDCITRDKLNKKLDEMEITEKTLWEMVYKKLDPVIEKATNEFEQTEEFKVKQAHEKVVSEYYEAKEEFERIYGKDTYKYCYDVFGELRNEEYLETLKLRNRANERQDSSYRDNNQSNYKENSWSSYLKMSHSNYSLEEVETAEEIINIGYRQLAKKLHPDAGGNKEDFQRLGSLKEKMLSDIKP